ncbi:circadian clock protein KaiC [Archangium gephyra]|uniref:non-specific serine/threonine protein kinase n=1 Tax=Archangium gephyra TaxID=48 RepID=A0AAC8Q3Q9_9BACT|nr:circadian clock protein KaiC [Archangium gephyra]AKI99870.1 Circadian clock protein KaiC [Archangium gephyra]REG33416.1 circadian clock protein KaiC [Archangium gephyra]
MSAIQKLPTGVPGLDIITYGGIPQGRTTLITGKSGAGKSILSLQIACNLARLGVKTVVLSIEETAEDLIATADTLGFDLASLVKQGQVVLTDLTRPMEGPTHVSGNFDVEGLVHLVSELVKKSGATAVVLDSATALFSPRPPEAHLRSHFFRLVSSFRQLGLTAVMTAEAPADYGQLTTLGVEDFVCDTVLVLRNLVDGERRRRSIEVHKYRRSAHYKGEYPCTMTLQGLTVFPLDARHTEQPSEDTRFPSGVAGLDAMTRGGWLRDSIVLVRGPSGSGKTTLAGMYARAGALRGERVIYYGFEETKPILMRNFAKVGLSLKELEASGHLKVECRYPEATSPEDLLVELRSGLANFKPSLIVVDSISSIEHSTSERGFRQFMVGLSSLIREHSRSALLIQTVGTFVENDAAPPYLSTIPDAILLMDYARKEHGLERTMTVLKMRGSEHTSAEHRMTIVSGGLQVEPLGWVPSK